MSDPQPTSLHDKPPRAEPLQPDRPGRGTSEADSTVKTPRPDSKEKTVVQETEAVENVKRGYD